MINASVIKIACLMILLSMMSCTGATPTGNAADDPVAGTVQAAQTQTRVAVAVQQTLNPATPAPLLNIDHVQSLSLRFDVTLSSDRALNAAGETSISVGGGSATFQLQNGTSEPNFYLDFSLLTYNEDYGFLSINGQYYSRNSRYQSNWTYAGSIDRFGGFLSWFFRNKNISPSSLGEDVLGLSLAPTMAGWNSIGQETLNGLTVTHYARGAAVDQSPLAALLGRSIQFSTSQIDLWISQDGLPQRLTLKMDWTDSSANNQHYIIIVKVDLSGYNEPVSLPNPIN